MSNNTTINVQGFEVMTLRDYFASMAPMTPPIDRISSWQDVVVDKGMGNKKIERRQVFESHESWCSRWAYQYADAMLEARSK